ncbi:MAG: DUF1592 domain-containing protein [Opitutaceae bacterium]|nr:DUF1592 domain-containing protein [Opitutaceae bacterium]
MKPPPQPVTYVADTRGFISWRGLAVIGVVLLSLPASGAPLPETVSDFIDQHCASCHDASEKKGNLDFDALTFQAQDPINLNRWIKVFDRARSGEMPPKKRSRPESSELDRFLASLSQTLSSADQAIVAQNGRAVRRRLNRFEYENSLRDLLSLPNLSLRDSIPEDTAAYGFNKVGEALDTSHVHLSRYLAAGDNALRAAIAPRRTTPQSQTIRYHTWDQPGFIKVAGPELRKTFPLVGLDLQRDLVARGRPIDKDFARPKLAASEDPVRRDQESVAMLMSTYEPAEIQFNRFRAPVSARYRLRFSGYAIRMAPDYTAVSRASRDEPVVIYAATPPRLLRRLGGFDFGPEPTVRELDVWLQAGETIQPDAVRLVRSRPPDFKNPLATSEGMPGVAFQWLEVEGPLLDDWPGPGHRLLFGDLPFADPPSSVARVGKNPAPPRITVTSTDPETDAARLMSGFAGRAFRRPVASTVLEPYLGIVRRALSECFDFTEAMLAGYGAVLASPRFLFLDAQPGPLDGFALAERLAYFLWNSPPDPLLRSLAADGSLLRPATLRDQTERMLDDPRAQRFVEAFLDYWLDLRQIGASGPDAALYPEYQLDDHLLESMLEEPRLYFAELLRHDLGVDHLVASDFAMLNERLAAHYGISGVTGSAMRRVPLPEGSVRGGLITQAAVLKVTANGTTTSPVVRGAWIMRHILGQPPPPPPPSVPAVESDIRGATTIREQLALHRAEESCAACHRSIDPPGFALESFDVMGGWRDHYRSVGQGEPVTGIGHHGLKFTYRIGPAVDASGEMPDGRPFADIRSFKANLLADEAVLARNLVQQLTVYATGAPIRFSDRGTIEAMVRNAERHSHGVRSIIHEIVQSDLFQKK